VPAAAEPRLRTTVAAPAALTVVSVTSGTAKKSRTTADLNLIPEAAESMGDG
jgi:hypothetical protein